MQAIRSIIALFAVMLFSGPALAVPPGMTVEYTMSPLGKVVFDGKLHADKGLTCDKCHTAVFQMKKGTAQIKMADHMAGKDYCFACHNGTVSFKSEGNCARCHGSR
jgi:c(7)-type cytochrome triheme protein